MTQTQSDANSVELEIDEAIEQLILDASNDSGDHTFRDRSHSLFREIRCEKVPMMGVMVEIDVFLDDLVVPAVIPADDTNSSVSEQVAEMICKDSSPTSLIEAVDASLISELVAGIATAKDVDEQVIIDTISETGICTNRFVGSEQTVATFRVIV